MNTAEKEPISNKKGEIIREINQFLFLSCIICHFIIRKVQENQLLTYVFMGLCFVMAVLSCCYLYFLIKEKGLAKKTIIVRLLLDVAIPIAYSIAVFFSYFGK